jgi:regulator of sirC expression with transglutaminase-like and TPR domain
MDLNKNEVQALISLLDDSDTGIIMHVEQRILILGRDVIPSLEDAWSSSFDPTKQQRIESLIHKINFDSLLIELQNWQQNNSLDIIAGTILIARYQYPDLDEARIYDQLNQLKRSIWLELNFNLTALEKVNVMNRVLFDTYLFKGNTANFHSPSNSYINIVLDTKKANPLLLSIIYMFLAQQLDMPIAGVNLPEHFVLAYLDDQDILNEAFNDNESSVLFYINAFSRGTIFHRNEIDSFLKKLDLEPNEAYYQPCRNEEILKRMLRNLIFAYQKLGEIEKVEELEIMLKVLK